MPSNLMAAAPSLCRCDAARIENGDLQIPREDPCGCGWPKEPCKRHMAKYFDESRRESCVLTGETCECLVGGTSEAHCLLAARESKDADESA